MSLISDAMSAKQQSPSHLIAVPKQAADQTGSAPMAITLHAEGITPHTRLFSVDPAIVQAMGEMLTAREKAPVARF